MAEPKLTIVIKIGTSSLLKPYPGEMDKVSLANISRLIETICKLRRENWNVVLVTSGAVGFGAHRLGLKERPKEVAKKQALAAVGQMRLMRLYDDLFSYFDQPCAQILLTYENLDTRTQYINAKNTFKELLDQGIVPIVNENDTVAVQELRFGDNDTLSAMVAGLVDASYLFLLTDVDGLYTANPRTNPEAKPIHVVENISELTAEIGGSGSSFGTGGMSTKITAAKLATGYGVCTVICNGTEPEQITEIINGAVRGTKFLPQSKVIRGRQRWILALPPQGSISVDAGASKAISQRKSLFAAGITAVTGNFGARDGTVRLISSEGKELARGLSNYSSAEVRSIMGKHSHEIHELVGYVGPEWVVSRENYALYDPPKAIDPTGASDSSEHDGSGRGIRRKTADEELMDDVDDELPIIAAPMTEVPDTVHADMAVSGRL